MKYQVLANHVTPDNFMQETSVTIDVPSEVIKNGMGEVYSYLDQTCSDYGLFFKKVCY